MTPFLNTTSEISFLPEQQKGMIKKVIKSAIKGD